MASGHQGAVLREFHRLFATGTLAGLTEGQLLDRFVSGRDEAAFEALVARHGPMVLTVCRRLLRDEHEVEDAFQAAFLVLVRKAGSLRQRELLGNWLYGVAHRVAVRARSEAGRRRAREQGESEAPFGRAQQVLGFDSDLQLDLHGELGRLPENLRSPVVLCYLEGLTHDEAALRLRWPVGTVRSRLARARDLLRARLSKRGLAPTAGAVAAALEAQSSMAAVPPALLVSTVKTAMHFVAGQVVTAGAVPASVITLTEGVLRTMTLTKLKTAAFLLTAFSAVATGAGVFAYQDGEGGEQSAPQPQPAAVPAHVAVPATPAPAAAPAPAPVPGPPAAVPGTPAVPTPAPIPDPSPRPVQPSAAPAARPGALPSPAPAPPAAPGAPVLAPGPPLALEPGTQMPPAAQPGPPPLAVAPPTAPGVPVPFTAAPPPPASAEPIEPAGVLPGTAGPVGDDARDRNVSDYLDRTRKEVDAAINRLSGEVRTLSAQLDKAKVNLSRLQALKAALDQSAHSESTRLPSTEPRTENDLPPLRPAGEARVATTRPVPHRPASVPATLPAPEAGSAQQKIHQLEQEVDRLVRELNRVKEERSAPREGAVPF